MSLWIRSAVRWRAWPLFIAMVAGSICAEGDRQHKLSEHEKQCNRNRSKIRSSIDHIFVLWSLSILWKISWSQDWDLGTQTDQKKLVRVPVFSWTTCWLCACKSFATRLCEAGDRLAIFYLSSLCQKWDLLPKLVLWHFCGSGRWTVNKHAYDYALLIVPTDLIFRYKSTTSLHFHCTCFRGTLGGHRGIRIWQ